MVAFIPVHCHSCDATDVIKHGITDQGKQRYRCQNANGLSPYVSTSAEGRENRTLRPLTLGQPCALLICPRELGLPPGIWPALLCYQIE